MKGRCVTAGDVADEAVRLRPFFRRSGGGVTLSGGEPMLQPDFSYAVAALCRAEAIHVALETTGHVAWRKLKRMVRVVDLFLYDVKHADPERHRAFTGADNRLILRNLQRLVEVGANVVARVPLIPGHNDSPDEVRAIARAGRACGATQMTLLPYNPATSGKYGWLRRACPMRGATRQGAEVVGDLNAIVAEAGLSPTAP
jgi:pyruvate formate lyase activating enzyme